MSDQDYHAYASVHMQHCKECRDEWHRRHDLTDVQAACMIIFFCALAILVYWAWEKDNGIR